MDRNWRWGPVFMFLTLTCVACTRQVRTASPLSYSTAPTVHTNGEVKHAIEAGPGDVLLRELRRRLIADPDDLDARLQIAQHYLQIDLPDLAVEHYRLAAALFPDSDKAALALVAALRDMDAPWEAVKAAQAYLIRHPHGSWELLSLQGVIEDEQGQFVGAEASYRDALTAAPERSPLHNNLGYNLLLQGRPDEAAAEFRRAIELDPKSQIAHNNLGVALASQQGLEKEALEEWQRSSSPAAAHNNLAAILMGQGRDGEARSELSMALASQPDFQPALANLKILSAKDRPEAAPAVPSKKPSVWAKLFDKKKLQPASATTSTAEAAELGEVRNQP